MHLNLFPVTNDCHSNTGHGRILIRQLTSPKASSVVNNIDDALQSA